MQAIMKLCYVKVWIFSRWHVSTLSRNAGGVAAVTPHPPVYRRDAYRQTTGIILQRRWMYRKRRMACCNVIDARAFGTWPLIVDICRVASVAASRTVLSSVPGHAITQYAVIAPGLIMPVDSFSVLCRNYRSVSPYLHYIHFMTQVKKNSNYSLNRLMYILFNYSCK